MGGLLPHLRGRPHRWSRRAVGGLFQFQDQPLETEGPSFTLTPSSSPSSGSSLTNSAAEGKRLQVKEGQVLLWLWGQPAGGTPSGATGGGGGPSQLHHSGLPGCQVSSVHLKKGLHSQQTCQDRCEGEIRPFMGKCTFQILKTVAHTRIRYHSEETRLRGFGRPNGLKGISQYIRIKREKNLSCRKRLNKKRREKGEEMEGGGKGEKKPRALLCRRCIRTLSVCLCTHRTDEQGVHRGRAQRRPHPCRPGPAPPRQTAALQAPLGSDVRATCRVLLFLRWTRKQRRTLLILEGRPFLKDPSQQLLWSHTAHLPPAPHGPCNCFRPQHEVISSSATTLSSCPLGMSESCRRGPEELPSLHWLWSKAIL